MAAITAALLGGCASQKFNISGDAAGAPRLEDSQTFFLSGIGQSQSVDAAKVCGGAPKVRSIEVIAAPLDNLRSILSFGIYTPRTAKVFCS